MATQESTDAAAQIRSELDTLGRFTTTSQADDTEVSMEIIARAIFDQLPMTSLYYATATTYTAGSSGATPVPFDNVVISDPCYNTQSQTTIQLTCEGRYFVYVMGSFTGGSGSRSVEGYLTVDGTQKDGSVVREAWNSQGGGAATIAVPVEVTSTPVDIQALYGRVGSGGGTIDIIPGSLSATVFKI
jgi:hypothetical protein